MSDLSVIHRGTAIAPVFNLDHKRSDIPEGHGQAFHRGDSMAPTILHGDLLLVDLRVNTFMADGIYAFEFHDWAGDGLMVRRLIGRIDGTVHMICDNPAYDNTIHTLAQIEAMNIVGRVAASWTMRSH